MYASALPVAACYFRVWAPPETWPGTALSWFALVLAILIRTAIPFYETPRSPLVAELTDNYDQLTELRLSSRRLAACYVEPGRVSLGARPRSMNSPSLDARPRRL